MNHNYIAITRTLLRAGANPNGGAEMSPLVSAIQKGHDEIVKLLLANRANPHGSVNDRVSPFTVAVRKGRVHNIELLMEYNVNLEGNAFLI